MASEIHPLLQQDLQSFVCHYPFGRELAGSTFMITGATGFIGSILVHCLLSLDQDIHIIALLRDKGKALTMLSAAEHTHIDIIECDVCTYDYSTIGHVDYIIHCAAPTSGQYFVEHAVETSTFIYKSTDALLRYAQQYPVKSFVFISSLEVYGQILDDSIPVTEEMHGYIDPMSPRSSYPMAKMVAENLCSLYAHQYGVPAKVARLTQTTGVGVSLDNNRVVNQFARQAALGKDIVLHTSGESAKPYCYTLDAIDAILAILLKGKNAESYNVSNGTTYISIRQLAEYLRDNYSPSIQIHTELDASQGYAPETHLRLSSDKLSGLGWQPRYDLKAIFDRLIPWFSQQMPY